MVWFCSNVSITTVAECSVNTDDMRLTCGSSLLFEVKHWFKCTRLVDLDHAHTSGMRAVWRTPGPELQLDWPCGPQGWGQLERVAVGKQQALIEVKEQFCLYLSPSFSLPVFSLFLTLYPPHCDATLHSASKVRYFQLQRRAGLS